MRLLRAVLTALLVLAVLPALAGCRAVRAEPASLRVTSWPGGPPVPALSACPTAGVALARAAATQVGKTVTYDAAYVKLGYPGGDVPIERGVCTDVVVRAFRARGVDLQVEVHEDMTRAWGAYPRRWGLRKPDPNIDHRRVPNLQVFFRRAKASLPLTTSPSAYLPGDVVTWDVLGRPHIGIVAADATPDRSRFLVVHNIGAGVVVADDLFTYPVTGHYRYFR